MKAKGYEPWLKAGKPHYTVDDAPGKVEHLPCGECRSPMILSVSRFGLYYRCSKSPNCRGTHGAHPWGEPRGIPADSITRSARQAAHKAFDRIWKRGVFKTRRKAYSWLSDCLGIEEAHIGEMDLQTCNKTIALCVDMEPVAGSRP